MWIALSLLFALGVAVGRLTTTEHQRITHKRLERRRWHLVQWERDLDAQEGRCVRCATRAALGVTAGRTRRS